GELEVFDTHFPASDLRAGLGIASLPGLQDAALNGELLAVLTQSGASSRRIALYDIGPHAGNYVLRSDYVASVRATGGGSWQPQGGLRYRGDRLEWHSGNALWAA